MSTRISRLHADTSGLASVEFILAIPVFLVMLLVIMDLGSYRTAMLHGTIAARNAAWSTASEGACVNWDDLPPLIDDRTIPLVPFCNEQVNQAAGPGFWQALDQAGGERLTGTVSAARAPQTITSRVIVFYEPRRWPGMAPMSTQLSFTMLSRQPFMHSDPTLRAGHDQDMYRIFSTGTGQLMQLFPNVFPGAR